jgi:signal transduction histidine kinase
MLGQDAMVRFRGRHVQRAALLAAVLLALTVLAFLALQAGRSSTAQMAAVEAEAMGAGSQIVALADARVAADLEAMHVLAALITGADDAFIRDALDRTVAALASWRAVGIFDRATGEVRHSAPRSSGLLVDPAGPLPASGMAEGVRKDGFRCPCVRIILPIADNSDLAIFVHVNPDVYQRSLMDVLPEGTVGALVDREGEFLARSLDYENRVGTPGTSYVRDAVAVGGQGFYLGKTYEGLANYTAYSTSALTGWSGHVAVNRVSIDQPRAMSAAATFGGAAVALLLAGGLLAYLVGDIARRAENERRMMELQKAEAIGEFTSSVVHDFRNLLAIMQSAVHLIRQTTRDETVLSIAAQAEKAAERGAKLVNQLLSFARRDGADVETVDLRRLVDGIEELLRTTLGNGVDLGVSIDDNARSVRANPDQLELALINLASNARHAMSGRGSLQIDAVHAGAFVEVRISDTGPGVPEEVRQRVFEPFFTTRPVGAGTGLGLAQVAGAANHAGGSVEVTDAPSGGAAFLLRLPSGQGSSR